MAEDVFGLGESRRQPEALKNALSKFGIDSPFQAPVDRGFSSGASRRYYDFKGAMWNAWGDSLPGVDQLEAIQARDENRLKAAEYGDPMSIQDVKSPFDFVDYAQEILGSQIVDLTAIAAGAGGGFLVGGPLGAKVGGGAALGAVHSTDTKSGVLDEGFEGDVSEWGAAAATKTALDLIPFNRVLNKLGGQKAYKDALADVGDEMQIMKRLEEIEKMTGKKFDANDVMSGAFELGTMESIIELSQSYIDQANLRYLKGQDLWERTPEERMELIDSMFGGFLGGAALGGAADVVSKFINDPSVIQDEEWQSLNTRLQEIRQEQADERERRAVQADFWNHKVGAQLPEAPVVPPPAEGVPMPEDDYQEVAKAFDSMSDENSVYQPWVMDDDDMGVTDTGYIDVETELRVAQEKAAAEINALDNELAGDALESNPARGVNVAPEGQPGEVLASDRTSPTILGHAPDERLVEKVLKSKKKDSVLDLRNKDLHDKDFLKESGTFLKNFMGTLAKKFTPGMRVVVMDVQDIPGVDPNTTAGVLQYDRKTDMMIIGINAGQFNAAADNAKAMQILAHEFGHGLMAREFEYADGLTRRSIMGEYQSWLGDMKNLTTEQFVEKYEHPTSIGRWNKMPLYEKVKGLPASVGVQQLWGQGSTAYHFSFNEYFAQQFAKYVMDRAEGFQPMTEKDTLFEKIYQRIKAVMKIFSNQSNWSAESLFTTYLDRIQKVHRMKEGNLPAAKKFVSETAKKDMPIWMQNDPQVTFVRHQVHTSDGGAQYFILSNETSGIIGSLSIGKTKDGLLKVTALNNNIPAAVILKFIEKIGQPKPGQRVAIDVESNHITGLKRLTKAGFSRMDMSNFSVFYKQYPISTGNKFLLEPGSEAFRVVRKTDNTKEVGTFEVDGDGNLEWFESSEKASVKEIVESVNWEALKTYIATQTDTDFFTVDFENNPELGRAFYEAGAFPYDNQDGTYTFSVAGYRTETKNILPVANLTHNTPLSKMADTLEKIGVPSDTTNTMKNFGDLAMRGWGFFKKALTPLQVAERYNFDLGKRYMKEIEEYAKTKTEIMAEADEVARVWKRLPKQRANELAKFIFNLSILSDDAQKRFEQKDILDFAHGRKQLNGRTYKLDPEAIEIYFRMEQSFSDVLKRLEEGLLKSAAKRFTNNPQEFVDKYLAAETKRRKHELIDEYAKNESGAVQTMLEGKSHPLYESLTEINRQFEQLRNRNYFPRSRFGQYTIRLTAKNAIDFDGKKFEAGETAAFWTYETKREWEQAKIDMVKEYGSKFDVTGNILSEQQYSFLGMPQILIEKMKTDPKMELSADQREALDFISLQLSPGKTFLRHLEKRKGIKGYSEDALRTYASYMVSAANHMARVQHSEQLIATLNEMEVLSKKPETMNLAPVTQLHDYFKQHYKYVMNPENDWAKYRALGFLWYLGFNVKSAFVNLTQVPMVTYPLLGARHGDAAALKAIGKAGADITALFRGKDNLTDTENKALVEALKAGITDQSFATELAGLTDGEAISQILPIKKDHKMIAKLSDWGGFMFKHTEQFNRRVAFLASFRLAYAETKDFDAAFESAKDAVQKTMFEYSKWNRPEIMRGKKSVIFMFMQHVQHMSYLMYGLGNSPEAYKTAMRSWMVMFGMAGLLGLPGMEILLDIIDLGGTKFKEMTGMKNPRVDVRESIREAIVDTFDISPDILMRGLGSHYGLGALSMGESFGLPNVDISGSLSMGYMLPWVKDTMDPEMQTDQRLLNLVKNLAGPVAQMPYNIVSAVASDDPDMWKRVERALPIAAKSVSKAARWSVRGEETLSGGARFKEWDLTSAHDVLSLVYQSLGFAPSDLTKQYEEYGAIQEMRLYWNARRQVLMETYAYAVNSRDREGIAAARKDIRRFNHSIQGTKLRRVAISSKDLNASVKARENARKKKEAGRPPEKMFESQADAMRRLFGEA